MANPSKLKGDRGEREAMELLRTRIPWLLRPNAQRQLGAGRKEDVGDLFALADTAIQVRNLKRADLGKAIRSSALDAVDQARNGAMPLALGMVPIPGASKDSVRWLGCAVDWPIPLSQDPVHFEQVSRAVGWVRDDRGPHGYLVLPRTERIGRLNGGVAPVLFAPIEAWLTAYVHRKGSSVPSPNLSAADRAA